MSSDSSPLPPEPEPSFSYDDGIRHYEVREITRTEGSILTTYSCGPEPLNPTWDRSSDRGQS